MSRYRIEPVVFVAGLAAVCWIGAGYAVSNPLAFAVTLLIGICYVAGALELRRYSQATATLARAVADLSAPPRSLNAWLEPLNASLRNPVRLRVEGERVALPGPALTPYLVGLLVLLGMLGTLLGMVMTLRGTGIALESATDLQAIRDSLAAPVKGLGFAFGTSIAGVATSAMLGLLSALVRRERVDAAQALDARIATTLRPFSQSHQRDESFRLLQRQADMMPALVDRLQAMMAALEQQSLTLHERQLASQNVFHGKAEAVYSRLAASVEQSLKDSIADSTRAAGAALQPVMQATMAGLSRETTVLHEALTQAVQRQLDGLTGGFETTAANVSAIWEKALADHQRASGDHARQLRISFDQMTASVEQRSAALLDGVSARLDATAGGVAAAWNEALARQESAGAKLASDNQQALAAASATFERHAASLVQTVGGSHADLQTELRARDDERLAVWTATFGTLAATLSDEWKQAGAQSAQRQQAILDALKLTASEMSAHTQTHAQQTVAEIDRLVLAAAEAPKAAANLQAELATRDQERFTAWTDSLRALTTTLSDEWKQAGAQSTQRQQEILDALKRTANEVSEHTQTHARHTIAEIDRLVQVAAEAPKAAANLQAELAARDQERFTEWTDSLRSLATTLSDEWKQTGTQSAERQQAIVDTLERTARDITGQSQAHASETIAEISRLVQAASEAPKAAAEVVAELRQKLSDSMVRDTEMLQERSRLMETLEMLLDAVNHASTEQRTAVDALVATSAGLLERVGTQFTEKVEQETGKLGEIAAHVTGSAVEVASLGEAFGVAVQLFGESNDKLMTHLQRIETALDKSLARSDEQLAYYVAQAREVVDLSVMSQKQIVEDLQQLAGRRSPAGAQPA